MNKILVAEVPHDFTSIQVNIMQTGASVMLHNDKYNECGNLNSIVVYGNFTGGRLWLEGCGSLPPPPELDALGQYRDKRGGYVTIHPGEVFTLDAQQLHGIEEIRSGIRYSTVAHTPQLRRVREQYWKSLRWLGFPISTVKKVWHEQYNKDWKLHSGPWKGRQCLWHTGSVVSKTMIELGYVAQQATLNELQPQVDNQELCLVYTLHNGLPCDFMAECEYTDCKVLPRQVRRGIEAGLVLLPEKPEVDAVIHVYPVMDGDQDLEGEDVDEDLDNQDLDAPAWSADARDQTAIQRLHDNLGHPDLRRFLRTLRRAGIRPEVLRWISTNFRCASCEATRRPPHRNPAIAPRTFGVNQLVGLDLVELLSPVSRENEFFLNVTCWGSGFNQMLRVPSKYADDVWAAYVNHWVTWMGHANTLIVDQGREFAGDLAIQAGAHGTLVHVTDVESPLQNSKTERTGGEVKEVLKAMLDQQLPVDDREWITFVSLAVAARNMHSNISGFSPYQIHRCRNTCLLKIVWMRCVRVQAWATAQCRLRVQRAGRARHRIPQQPLMVGLRVFVFRKTPRQKVGAWHGPGVVMMPTATGAYVNMKGALWKVNRECIRAQNEEEMREAEITDRFLQHLSADLSEGKVTKRPCARDHSGRPCSRGHLGRPCSRGPPGSPGSRGHPSRPCSEDNPVDHAHEDNPGDNDHEDIPEDRVQVNNPENSEPQMQVEENERNTQLVRRRREMDAAETEILELEPRTSRPRTMPWPAPPSWSFVVTLKHGASGAWWQAEELEVEGEEQMAQKEIDAASRRDITPCCFCRKHGRWRQ
eukprot:6491144-Amphidinium_carterae.1